MTQLSLQWSLKPPPVTLRWFGQSEIEENTFSVSSEVVPAFQDPLWSIALSHEPPGVVPANALALRWTKQAAPLKLQWHGQWASEFWSEEDGPPPLFSIIVPGSVGDGATAWDFPYGAATFSYDAQGRLATKVVGIVTLTYSYSNGKLAAVTDGFNIKIFNYALSGALAGVEYMP